ncbi:hypothetical protein KBTX_03586 [wastewater metagenome]|uniref:Type 4 fimbrial biogenesis protein PilX N-terminal domain-containing protein n=2 Tax=unclassified sequences TaxID=12908 RepID=A0A5B8RH78_9ZZZZ|nr:MULTISPECIES: PilX N-terminal domain-containing pilus assembly protein [Arhodomonas]MCS4502832.1 PilX N-terminal domain-containing pilus assembly protein [Arhodomonas aquaeolei]QEA07238.1 hypothetical protein KBTEX_03586 [uncultured organism]
MNAIAAMPPARQRGVVLAISLIFLLLLTLIGVTAMQSTTLQERMTGSFRNRDLAFQAAEAGLRAAEDWIDGIVSTAALDGANGKLGEGNTEPDYLSMDWSSSDSFNCGVNMADVASQPRCVVKYLGKTAGSANNRSPTPDASYGGGAGSPTLYHFQITVRGVGGSENAEVFLRSRYVTAL